VQYVCKVGTPSGEVLEQSFTASDEASLRADLEQRGYYVFRVRRGLGLQRLGLGLGRARVATDIVMIFGQELAALLKAGLPLLQSLDIMLERQRDPVFRRSLGVVRDKVKAGVALSEAFREEGDLYSPILAASLVAGERSGNLEGVLRRFVQYLRLNLALRKKAVAASIYPIALFVMMVTLVGVLMVKVIPEFQKFYGDFEVELPWITRLLMAVSTLLSRNIALILLGLVAGLVVFGAWSRRPGAGVLIDGSLLRIPWVGGLMRMYATAQLSRTLSSLLAGGLPLLNAMEVSAASVGNRAMAAAVGRATPLIREGKSLTTALDSTGMLENLPLEMVRVGEQTGALGDMLNAIADFYDEEMETRLATVIALIEPIVLVLMAVIVAGMLLAFYLPLFEAISAIQSARG
jgi:type IV pilus assembly protein PilC